MFSLSEFRPIACCNVLYKIILKILANRLQKIISNLIFPNQSAFIKGRLISDNILLLHELVRGFSSSVGTKRAALKVDLKKAYDSVRRKFLWKILADLGFSPKWISWMQTCVGSLSCSILINGSSTWYIVSTKGLRQGDHLSPYLFTLMMETLTVLLESEIIKGSLSIPRRNFGVSYLIFVDDILVFCKGDLENLSAIEAVFNNFATMSDLQISNEKSVLFLSEACQNKVQIFQKLGFKEGKFPMRHLGVPLVDRKLRHTDCSKLLEMLKNMTFGWIR